MTDIKINVWQIEDIDPIQDENLEINHNSLSDIGPNDHHDKFTIEDHSQIDHSGLVGVGVSKQAIVVTKPNITEVVSDSRLGMTMKFEASNSMSAFSELGETDIVYKWYIDSEYQSEGTSFELYLDPNKYNVGDIINLKCKAIDSLGNHSYWTIKSITVEEPPAAIIDSYSWNDTTFIANKTYILTINAHDPANTTLTYNLFAYNSYAQLAQITKQGDNTFSIKLGSPEEDINTYLAEFKVVITNGLNKQVEQIISINVIKNVSPMLKSLNFEKVYFIGSNNSLGNGLPITSNGFYTKMSIDVVDYDTPFQNLSFSVDTHNSMYLYSKQDSNNKNVFYLYSRNLYDRDINETISINVSDGLHIKQFNYDIPIKKSSRVTNITRDIYQKKFYKLLTQYLLFKFHVYFSGETLGVKTIFPELFTKRIDGEYSSNIVSQGKYTQIKYPADFFFLTDPAINISNTYSNNIYKSIVTFYPTYKYTDSEPAYLDIYLKYLIHFYDYSDREIGSIDVVVSSNNVYIPANSQTMWGR